MEVVIEKEFIGGSILQGICANLRDKLCVWNHLLKILVANIKVIVESAILSGLGRKVVVKKLMKDTRDNEAKEEEEEARVREARLDLANAKIDDQKNDNGNHNGNSNHPDRSNSIRAKSVPAI